MKTCLHRFIITFSTLTVMAFAGSAVFADDPPKKETEAEQSRAVEDKVIIDEKGRVIQHVDRPELLQDTVILAKATFWPLCYEPLDQLEETRSLIGSGDEAKLAASLEKCGSWLERSGQAARVDDDNQILIVSDRLYTAARNANVDDRKLTDDELQKLISLAEMLMAKSHILRGGDPDYKFKADYAPNRKQVQSTPVVRAANIEINEARMQALRDQFVYDSQQTMRHIAVAQLYLKQAAEAGGFELPEELARDLPTLPNDVVEIADFDIDKIQPLMADYLAFIRENRIQIFKDLDLSND